MKLFRFCSVCGWCLCLSTTVPAATFSLAEVVPAVLAHNPDLVAARLTIEEARGRRVQAGRLTNPDLEGEFKPQINGGGQGAQGVLAFGVMQRLPLTARLRLEREVSQTELAVVEAEVRDAARRLAGEALLGAVNWLALDAQRLLKQRQLANSRELVATAAKAATVGEGSNVDAAQFDLEAQELAAQLLQLEADREELAGQLRPWLGVPGTEPLEITGELSPVADTGTTATPLLTRPDYQAALARRETADRAVALARANRWQDIGVGVFGELERVQDQPVGVVQENFVGLRISLPLPLWNRNEGRIQESAATVERVERESEALAFRIRSEVEAAQRQMVAAARLEADLSTGLLPNAVRLEQRLEKLRTEGQATLTDELRARERRFRLESTRVDALRDYHRAQVRLAVATGTIVPTMKAP